MQLSNNAPPRGSKSSICAELDVSIIVVTYNSSHVILDCLAPIVAIPRVEVIVVDNASHDGTSSLVRTAHPTIKVIDNPDNDGFARAVNLAAESALGKTLLLLNPDATVSSNVLAELFTHLMESPKLAVVAPVLSDGKGEFRTVSAGFRPTVRHIFNHFAGLSRLANVFPWFSGHYLLEAYLPRHAVDVDWVSGGCMLVRRADWEALGGLSERWFMYAEDVEFCLRARAAGRLVRLLPRLRATHAIGGSSSNVDGRVNTAWIENLFDLYCWRLSGSRIDQEIWRLVVVLGFLGRAAIYGFRVLTSARSRSVSYLQFRKYAKFSAALLASRPKKPREPLEL